MNNDPQQELFIKLKTGMEALGYDVYDGFLPSKDALYPFVYLGNCQQTDTENKSAVFGTVYQTIHIWHNSPRLRGTVSGMMLNIKSMCRCLEHTNHFAWTVRSISQQFVTDTTTKTPLLHGILEVEFSFS